MEKEIRRMSAKAKKMEKIRECGGRRFQKSEYVLVELNTSHCFLMEFKGFIRSRGKVKIEPHHTAMILTELIL